MNRVVEERFPDELARRRWWSRPRRALGGQTPRQVCQAGFDPDGPLASALWELVRDY